MFLTGTSWPGFSLPDDICYLVFVGIRLKTLFFVPMQEKWIRTFKYAYCGNLESLPGETYGCSQVLSRFPGKWRDVPRGEYFISNAPALICRRVNGGDRRYRNRGRARRA